MACGAEFEARPAEGTLPPGGAVETRKFSCPACGAILLFDAQAGSLRCPFCGGTQAIPREEGYVAVENALEEEAETARRRDAAPKTLRCTSCGAEVAFPENVVSASCPFCGSAHVVEGAGDPGRIRPGSVVAFAVPEADARRRFAEWARRGWFRPRAFAARSAIEALRGVYLPFWTYDTRTWSRWTAQAGYRYTVTVGFGNQARNETRIRWEFAAGERRDAYDDVLVCGSRGVEERLLERTYPYRLDEAQPYRNEYLSGWGAEEYAVDLSEGWRRARERVNATETSRCARDVPGDTHRDLRVWTQHAGVTWKHLLLPVWVAAYRFREKPWVFLVNGQTGKVAGRAPVSWVKVAIAAALGAGLALLAWRFLGSR
jgi:predicted RNA-binding Zn-ribbon protein involved in translation (DUF1610 family)